MKIKYHKMQKVLKNIIKWFFIIFFAFTILMIIITFISLIKYSDTIIENKSIINENKSYNDKILTPSEYIRGGDNTFLTFPEWYLVFAPREQAEFFKNKTSSNYPYLVDTAGIWQTYNIVSKQIKGKYEYNYGYNLMIYVIGVSSSIEYNLKSIYESTIGKITDTGIPETQEDIFYGNFANNYVNFIYDLPWYEYDFYKDIKDFNKGNNFFGDNFIRKTERKVYINTELIGKYTYSKIIKFGTKTVYEQEKLTTTVLLDKKIDNLNNKGNIDLSQVKYIDEIKDNDGKVYFLYSLPRYERFKYYIDLLGENNINILEIAGNKGDILVSALVNNDKLKYFGVVNKIFTQKIVTKPNLNRVVFSTNVGNLSDIIGSLSKNGVKIEHIFDY